MSVNELRVQAGASVFTSMIVGNRYRPHRVEKIKDNAKGKRGSAMHHQPPFRGVVRSMFGTFRRFGVDFALSGGITKD